MWVWSGCGRGWNWNCVLTAGMERGNGRKGEGGGYVEDFEGLGMASIVRWGARSMWEGVVIGCEEVRENFLGGGKGGGGRGLRLIFGFGVWLCRVRISGLLRACACESNCELKLERGVRSVLLAAWRCWKRGDDEDARGEGAV